jgi:two-component system sensor histidine kinase KdpD
VGLEEVVPAALASLGGRADGVEVDVAETLPRVDADPGLLERALANVVANAVDWSPPGMPVRLVAGAVGEDRVDVRVCDRGPGIAPGDREAVFMPFQRRGDARAGVEGLGLGLAVARGFLEAMDGEVEIDDTPGGGATVVLRLRRAG